MATCLGSSVPADNLLNNAEFKSGKPGEADFGWTVELAKGQESEAVVVEGRQPGTAAICLRHDELGSSTIRQKIEVEPWRWYVAQMWVNSERMAAFGFSPSIRLEGGRSVSGERFHDDTFEWPKKGWRRLQVIAHSADRDTITLHMGGDRWSGELLFAEPVVRECSIVEAASYYPSVHHRHPTLYGPRLDPERNQHGYAFQKGDVCRVAPGYPNPLFIGGRMNSKAPEGRLSVAFPPGILFRQHQDRTITPKVSRMPNGFQRVELPPGKGHLLVDADLEPGEEAVGYVQFEWKGGFQVPTPVRFQGVALPDVPAPKRVMMMLGIAQETRYHWDDNQQAMVHTLKRFGFNHLESWGGDPRGFHRDGMNGVTAFGGGFYVDREKNPEAIAITLDGNPSQENLMSPSYRGPAMQPHIDRVIGYAKISSALTIDDEICAMSGGSPGIGFHPRTIERWNQWVAEHEPGLAGVDPRVFGRRPHKYRKHYDAWLDFRCDLVAERYAILHEAFHKAVEKNGVRTTPRTMLGAYVNDNPLVALHSNKALAPVLDYVANMVYQDGEGVRKAVARLAPVTGKKLVIAIAPGYQISPPGDARSQVLEAVMGGSQGVIAWGYYMGMTAGHLADISDAVKMFGPVEDIILDGAIHDGYACATDSVNLLARKQGDVQVLLVSDYSPRPRRVLVTVPGDTELEVIDLFTDQVVAHLDSRNRNFSATLRRDFAARLYRLQPPKQK
ncbi:MAG: hypothetical protein ACC645_22025 [Pirellulales bacterium]